MSSKNKDDFIFDNPLNKDNKDNNDNKDNKEKEESFCDKLQSIIITIPEDKVDEELISEDEKYKSLGKLVKKSLQKYKYLKEEGLYDSD